MHYFLYNENKKHGSDDFPAEYYYVDETHPNYNMPFHWHKEWEIIRILKGWLNINIDGVEYSVKEGDILLLNEGTLHGGTPQDCVYECFNFDLDKLFANVRSVRDYLRPFFRNKLSPTIYYPDYFPHISPIVDELLTPFAKHYSDALIRLGVIANISRLFAVLLSENYYIENIGMPSDTTEKSTQLKPVLEYIETHFSETISLTQLAAIIGMNPKYFCRFFSSITQQTPMSYVNYYRVEQAANLLSSTNMTVTEVGLECGFNDTCNFVKTFKKHKGTTTKQFKKKEQLIRSII